MAMEDLIGAFNLGIYYGAKAAFYDPAVEVGHFLCHPEETLSGWAHNVAECKKDSHFVAHYAQRLLASFKEDIHERPMQAAVCWTVRLCCGQLMPKPTSLIKKIME